MPEPEELGYPEKIGDKYYVRDSETGELLWVAGYGALEGMLDLDPDIDLTKPIWEQVYKKQQAEKARAEAVLHPKVEVA